MYKLQIELNSLPKSLNKALRTHHFNQRRQHHWWHMALGLKLNSKNLPVQPLANARISIVRHFYRTLDYDGLVGSLKPVVDALVTNKVLSDDSWKVTGKWDVNQVFRPKKDGPLLQILIEGE